MALKYNIEIQNLEETYRRGQMAKVALKFTDASAQVDSCFGEIVKYNIKRALNKSGENSYTLAIRIPIIAPRGMYQVRVYGVNRELGRGPSRTLSIKII